ncbi:MAG: CDP-alcohol phosphatidyltransferase family protein [Myxococcales bacterium]|jgi:phosphatidylglycerophosphate synthase/putative flippase GtrA
MEQIIGIVTGEMTPQARIWTALAPALLITAYFVFGFLAFLARCALWGVPRDAETVQRGGSLLTAEFLRHYFFWLIQPLWSLVLRSGIPPIALTTLSVLLGFASGIAAAAGRFSLAGWLFIFSGICDTLDGRVARTRKLATPWGAAIDSTLDRYTDSAILIGLAWYYRGSWVLLPVLLALMGGSLVPYVRARGEALGVSVKHGLAQRVDRVLYLGVGCALSPIIEAIWFPEDAHPTHWLAVASLCFLAVTSNYTAAGRLLSVVRKLREAAELAAPAGEATPAAGPDLRRPRMIEKLSLHLFAAVVATGVDFLTVLLLVEELGVTPALATAGGCAVGAAVNFSLNRAVTFRSSSAALPQMGRYLVVSVSSMLLNAGGVAVFALLPIISYQVSWWVVRAAVFLLWTYPLLNSYVFDDGLEKGHAI